MSDSCTCPRRECEIIVEESDREGEKIQEEGGEELGEDEESEKMGAEEKEAGLGEE